MYIFLYNSYLNHFIIIVENRMKNNTKYIIIFLYQKKDFLSNLNGGLFLNIRTDI